MEYNHLDGEMRVLSTPRALALDCTVVLLQVHEWFKTSYSLLLVSLASRLPSKTKVKRCLSAHCRSRCLSAHCSTRVELRFLCSTCDRQRPSRRSSTLQYTCCAKASRGAPAIEWVSVLGRDAGTRGAALSSVMGYARSAEPPPVVLSCFL